MNTKEDLNQTDRSLNRNNQLELMRMYTDNLIYNRINERKTTSAAGTSRNAFMNTLYFT